MNPLLLAGLLNFGVPALGGLFGDPKAKLRKQLMQVIQSQPALANHYFQQILGSPAFSQGQQQIAAGANQTQANLMQSLGARGIGTTGTGALLSSVLPSIVGGQQAQLRSNAYGQAQGMAQQSIQQQLAALGDTGGPSRGAELFGAGLAGFSPLLQNYLQSKYPFFRPYAPQQAQPAQP